jgi:hypothetical protein
MSTHKHATISAWQREEHGGYIADLNGWQLRVHWHPETDGGPAPKPPGARRSATKQRGFSWDAKHGDQPRYVSHEIHEEIELAMVAAESYPAQAEEAAAAARKAEAEAAETDAGH